jgi:hypothetical protein
LRHRQSAPADCALHCRLPPETASTLCHAGRLVNELVEAKQQLQLQLQVQLQLRCVLARWERYDLVG